jgi:hypothetical protein
MEVPAFRSERRDALCWTGVTSPLLVVVSLLVCSQVPRSRSIALHEILAILANNAGHFPGQGFHRGLLLHQEGMLAHGRVTSRSPSPALSYRFLPLFPAHLRTNLTRPLPIKVGGACSRRGTFMPVRQRRKTTAQGQRASRIVRPPSSRFFAKLHTICWLQSSQCHRDASSRALNIIGRSSRTNLREPT